MQEKREEKKSGLQKFIDLDPRFIYIGILILLSIPILKPLGLTLPISQATEDFHNIILALEPGDNVLVYSDTSAHGIGETGPGIIAFLTDAMRRPGVKIVVSSAGGYVPETPTIFDTTVFPAIDIAGKTYGVDYVNLGWTPGGETAVASLAEDIHSLYTTDHRGNLLENLPIMADIRSVEDFDLLVYAGGGNLGIVMGQLFIPSGKPGVQVAMAVHKPGAMTYYPDYINAYIFGMAQAGEYEKLINRPGKAVAASDSLSLGHLLLITLLLLGNFAYILERGRLGET